jgi:hypothetical protein
MEQAERLLNNPLLWGVVALIGIAFTFSGKLSLSAFSGLSWLACALAVFYVYRVSTQFEVKGVILVLATVAAACIFSILTILAVRWATEKPPERPHINFVPEQDRLTLINEGEKDFWLFGDKFGDEVNFGGPPRVVPRGGTYYLLTTKLNEWAVANIGQNGQRFVPFEMYFMDEAKTRKFIGKFNLLIIVNSSVVTIHTQILGVLSEDWKAP